MFEVRFEMKYVEFFTPQGACDLRGLVFQRVGLRSICMGTLYEEMNMHSYHAQVLSREITGPEIRVCVCVCTRTRVLLL